ncbi:hypothetical protein ISCGN_013270 [Ixodes scapularis]
MQISTDAVRLSQSCFSLHAHARFCKADPHVSDLACDETSDGDNDESQRRRFLTVACCIARFFGFLENVAHRLGRLLPTLSCGLPRRATARATAKRVTVACLVARRIACMRFILNIEAPMLQCCVNGN